jgi:predicted PurR-regulated permease PerM
MKKFAICLIMACLSLTLVPLQLNAATTEPTTIPVTKSNDAAEVKALELRLNELKEMDKSKMNSSEKKIMRKEVKSIKHRLHDIGGGVYISAGAIILILLLLLVL